MEFFRLKSFSFFIFLLGTISISCSTNAQQSEQEHLLVDANSFKEKISQHENPQLIDVRTKGEYENGSIKGAVNYDFLDGTFQEKISTLNKTETVYLFCARGGRSGKAAKLLKENGFQSVIDLDGGYSAWIKK